MKEKKEKPSYNVWQNVCYVVKNAWKTDKKLIFFLASGAFLTVGASVAEMYLPKTVVNLLEREVSILELIAWIVGFTILIALLHTVKAYCDGRQSMLRTGQRVLCYNQNLLDYYYSTDFCNLDQSRFQMLHEKADTTVQNNIAALENIFLRVRDLMSSILGFVIYLILLTAVHPLIMGLILVTTVVSFLLRRKINLWEKEEGEKARTGPNQRMRFMVNQADGMNYAKDIRLFNLGNWLKDIVGASKKILDDVQNKVCRKQLLIDLFDAAAILLREGVAYYYLIRSVLTADMPVDEFVLLFAAIAGFSTWITGIMEQYSVLHRQSLEICFYRDFIEYPSAFCHDGTKVEKAEAYELELRDVSFRYDGAEEYVLEHINLRIRPGEKLAIVGLNGAGKTTLIQLLCGLYDPTEGVVLLNGKDIRQYDRCEYYKLFSAVFQEFSILPASIAENVACVDPEQIDYKRLNRCFQLADIDRKIGSLPLKEKSLLVKSVNPDAVEFSGGETQRLMLARAIYKDAPILLLDEPTAALDPLAESRMYQHYNRLSEGKTAIYISHRLASTFFCDRILLIADKGIAEEGTHSDLMALGGRYAELFEIQSRYYKEEVTDHVE